MKLSPDEIATIERVLGGDCLRVIQDGGLALLDRTDLERVTADELLTVLRAVGVAMSACIDDLQKLASRSAAVAVEIASRSAKRTTTVGGLQISFDDQLAGVRKRATNLISDMHAKGFDVPQIVAKLNDLGWTTHRGRRWSYGAVYSTIKYRVSTGQT